MRKLLVAVVVALAAAGAALASSADYTIRADTSIGKLQVKKAPTIKEMTVAFGAPTSRRKLAQGGCRVVWRPRGLTIQLLDLNSDGDPCGRGGFLQATMIGRAWHTGNGLRIGDSLPRLKRLFPRASFHRGEGWWLVTRHACVEVGAPAYGGLVARAPRGKVAAFVVQIAPCE